MISVPNRNYNLHSIWFRSILLTQCRNLTALRLINVGIIHDLLTIDIRVNNKVVTISKRSFTANP